ncbi:FtsK/SpoIIIE domain-containing protein [Nocardia sp. NBC_01329]|uniref:FtsK/SpoIIIE domain-containing protein n=1 Tax=Nocardia sp. NBC_01329 TaxID=2903594 RepID=UPI002E102E80|nr:FtsK/SpoIIIE domain-containing protein [Nocardia sp. NBC_01329]
MLSPDLFIFGGSAAVTAYTMWRWRRLDGVTDPASSDETAGVPVELGPAASIVTNSAQLALMWPALGLGSWETGYPNITAATLTDAGMLVEVQMLGGQSLQHWAADATREALAAYFAVPEVRVTSPSPGFVHLELRTVDTLADSSPVTGLLAYGVDLEAVPIGVTEDHDLWRLRVMYSHILIAGATESGKGSVLWSIVNGLGPAIKAGLVDILLGDPKGGMEFGAGEDRLWTDFQWTADGIIGMLKTAEAEMQERAARFKAAGIRKFTPSAEEPLKVVVIDEYAALSAFATREQVAEGLRLLGLILTQGRAVGYSVIVAVQDPSKENMPNRQLFSTRIGLRFAEPAQTTMVHGQGAKDRGARCHEIPTTTPGVAYVGQDGSKDFQRVRAFWVSDDDITRIVDTYSPAQPDLSPQGDYSGFDPDDFGDELDPIAA